MSNGKIETLKQSPLNETLLAIVETQPLLENLAYDLLVTDRNRWNVVIGDDAGGRLVTHFVHRVLKDDGRDFQTFFVAGSEAYHEVNGSEPYDRYFREIAEKVGEPLRPLIVTESVYTGLTVERLREGLVPYSEQYPEVAALAIQEHQRGKIEYVGAVGKDPVERVFSAFESPAVLPLGRGALRKAWAVFVPENLKDKIRDKTDVRLAPEKIHNRTVGLAVDPNYPKPIARIHEARDGRLSARAYAEIEMMAKNIHHFNDSLIDTNEEILPDAVLAIIES